MFLLDKENTKFQPNGDNIRSDFSIVRSMKAETTVFAGTEVAEILWIFWIEILQGKNF